MNKTSLFIIVVIISVLSIQASPARCLNIPSENQWTGRLRDGTVINVSDLIRILKEHEKWIKHAENAVYALEEGKLDTVRKLKKAVGSGQITPADLSGANLRGADLTGVKLGTPFAGQFLGGADLSGADLRGANLSGADLTSADLSGAKLTGANLNNADLTTANLQGAHFRSILAASLKGANFTGANLSGTDLSGVDLSEVIFSAADLSKAYLQSANLKGNDLRGVDLRGANLADADLSGADLRGACLYMTKLNYCILKAADLRDTKLYQTDMRGADLRRANMNGLTLAGALLQNADLRWSNLVYTDLGEADLRYAELTGADLKHANLTRADLRGAPLLGADLTNAVLDNTRFLGAEGLPELQVSKVFSKQDSERFSGYQRKLMEWSTLAGSESWYRRTVSWLRLIFFDLTCRYGMNPGRSLIILICLVPYFAFFYLIALSSKSNKTGFWLIWSNGYDDLNGRKRRIRLTRKSPPKALPEGLQAKAKLQILYWCRLIRLSFVFSILSAVSIIPGNAGRLSRFASLGTHHYTITATGWARKLAGIQCLISAYLLGLWLATIFGNPF